MPNTARRFTAYSFYFWLALAVSPSLAGESPQPPEAAESREFRILISGELGGLWEGKDPLQPRGGLGDATHGVLGALRRLHADQGATVSILMGNNLGRAVKSDAQTSTSGLNALRFSEQRRSPSLLAELGIEVTALPLSDDPCLAALYAAAQEPERLPRALAECDWFDRYGEANLSFERCRSLIQDEEVPLAQASEQCDRELFIWLIEQNFQAVGLGPGDFNHTRCDPTLRELRHYPFAAANVFVRREESCRKEDCSLPEPFQVEEQIFPTDPLVLELPDEGIGSLTAIEIVESKSGMPANPFASRVLRYLRKESSFEHVYTLHADPGVTHTVTYSAGNRAAVDDGELSLSWPVPLWPETQYDVTVSWNNKHGGKVEQTSFVTFELFTVARKARRPSQQSLKTPTGSCALAEQRQPVLYRDPKAGQEAMPPWLYEGVPVIDVSRIEALDSPPPLRILAVMDEEYGPQLDRLPEARGPIPLLNQLRFLPMDTSIEYWQDVMHLLASFDALEAVVDGLAGNRSNLGPFYDTFIKLRCNEPTNSPWEDRAWKREKEAWEALEQASVGSGLDLHYDLRVASLRKTVARFRESAPLLLLAHADRERLGKLAEKFDDLALAVGQSQYKAPGPEPGARIEIVTPHEPTRVQSEEFAATLEEVRLGLAQSSPWRVTRVARTRHPVPGLPLKLLHDPDPNDPNTEPCCNGELERLTRKAIVNDNGAPLSDKASQNDRKHLRDWLGLEMRKLAGTEIALIQEGVIDPNTLDWLRALRRMIDGKPLDVRDATIEELSQVPGIDQDLARKIKAYRHPVTDQPIRYRQDLEYFWRNSGQVKDPNDARWSWVRWFVGPYQKPHVDHDFFVDQFFRRTVFVNYRLWRVMMTEDQLKKLRNSLGNEFSMQGLQTESGKVRLHFRELGGDAPVTVALLSNVASENGPFSVLRETNLLRRPILVRGPEPIGLQQMVRVLGRGDHQPADPPKDWIKVEKGKRDRRGVWTFSLNAAGIEFQDVQTAQGFTVQTNDERTETVEQRRVSLKPELVVAYRGERVDWTNTLQSEYETNRLGPNATPNPLSDLWRIRSEWDFFLRERSRVNFPLYTALSLESQWRRRLQEVELEGFENDPLTFPLNKRMELNSEYGIAVTNRKKSKFFRLGFTVGSDLNRITSVTVQHPNDPELTAEGNLMTIGAAIAMNGCEAPMMNEQAEDPQNPACFDPRTSVGVSLETEDRLTLGLAFRGQYELEFGSLAGDRELKFKTQLTEGNFFFRRDGSQPGQPQLRFLLTNELSVPIIGNLSFVPGVEWFVFRNLGGLNNGGMTVPRQTYWSLRPFFRIDYTFDLKPAFMTLAEGLGFRSP